MIVTLPILPHQWQRRRYAFVHALALNRQASISKFP